MKKFLLSIVFSVYSAVFFCGCLTLGGQGISAKGNSKTVAASLPAYSGPKVRIAVADFEIRNDHADKAIAGGLKEMLVSALGNSNRFSIVDLPAAAADNSSAVREDIKLPEVIITVAINEFEPQASGGRSGLGGGGGVSNGVLGGLLGASVNKSHVSFDIRVVNASTSEVLAATRVQGQASEVSAKSFNATGDGWALGSGLSIYAATPMEKAIKACIIETVRYIAQAIPVNYYKY